MWFSLGRLSYQIDHFGVVLGPSEATWAQVPDHRAQLPDHMVQVPDHMGPWVCVGDSSWAPNGFLSRSFSSIWEGRGSKKGFQGGSWGTI